jgi:hypothetical protein
MTNQTPKRKKKNLGCFLLFMFPLTLVILSLLIGIFSFYFSRSQYIEWEESFEADKLSSSYTYPERNKKLDESISSKLEQFIDPNSNTPYIRLNKEEFSYLLTKEYAESLPDNFNLEKTYTILHENEFSFYMKVKYKERTLPWIRIDLSKIGEEGFEFRAENLYIGSWNSDEKGVYFIKNSINEGLREAYLLIEQSHFTGRTIENIEIEDNEVIIRGGSYH